MSRVASLRRQAGAIVLGASVVVPLGLLSDRAVAGSGGAFVGGLIGGHVLTRAMDNDQRRTEAAERQAYQSQPQVVYQQAPSQGAQSTEQKLDELDSLAAKGYITQDEYKARRQSILDSM